MEEVTGRLEGWFQEQITKKFCVLYGFIYGDSKGRFPDGTWVRTSAFPNRECKKGDVVNTTYSTYLLGVPMVKSLTSEEYLEQS